MYGDNCLWDFYYFTAYSKTAPVSPTRYQAINRKQSMNTLLKKAIEIRSSSVIGSP